MQRWSLAGPRIAHPTCMHAGQTRHQAAVRQARTCSEACQCTYKEPTRALTAVTRAVGRAFGVLGLRYTSQCNQCNNCTLYLLSLLGKLSHSGLSICQEEGGKSQRLLVLPLRAREGSNPCEWTGTAFAVCAAVARTDRARPDTWVTTIPCSHRQHLQALLWHAYHRVTVPGSAYELPLTC